MKGEYQMSNRKKRGHQEEKQQSKNKIVFGSIALVLIIAVIGVIIVASGGKSDEITKLDTPRVTPETTEDVTQPSGPIRPEWITAEISDDTASIPTSEVAAGKMLHFSYTSDQGTKMNYMAYNLDGTEYVRANVCPPCRSVGFSLSDDILVCNSCGTRFSATTGDGISGACKAYPKAQVPHTNDGQNLTVDLNELVVAYQNTQQAGWP